MRFTILIALIVVLPLQRAEAIVFDFFWTADPMANPSIVSSSDPTASAVGTVEIDALAGESFTRSDVTAISVTASSAGGSFTFDQPIDALGFSGTVAADGSSAALTDFVLLTSDAFHGFGCLAVDCAALPGAEVFFNIGTAFDVVDYADQDSIRASFVLTAPAVIPLPASLPLALAGVLTLGFLARRRRSATGSSEDRRRW